MLQSSVAGRAPRPTAPVFNARTLKLRQHSRLYAHGKAGDEAPAGQDTPGLEHALQTFTSQFATLTTELKSLKKIVATKNDVHRLEGMFGKSLLCKAGQMTTTTNLCCVHHLPDA